jgi:hypothetical protein
MRYPNQKFSEFVSIILGSFEKEIEFQNNERNYILSSLIKHFNQVKYMIELVEIDKRNLE